MEIIKTSTKGKIFHTKKSKANLVNKHKTKGRFLGKPLSCGKKRISRVKEIEFFVRDE